MPSKLVKGNYLSLQQISSKCYGRLSIDCYDLQGKGHMTDGDNQKWQEASFWCQLAGHASFSACTVQEGKK